MPLFTSSSMILIPRVSGGRSLLLIMFCSSRFTRLFHISHPQLLTSHSTAVIATYSTTAAGDYRLAMPDEVSNFIRRCLVAAGAVESHAASLASTLVQADLRGHYSHGLNRLEMYCKELRSGRCDGKATPTVVKETLATALVDGHNGIGPVVGEFAMDLAISKAKEAGCAWVTATGSNHYGIAAHYTLRAVEQGLIGMSATNTSPLVVPTRAKECVLGTNPISFAAPSTKDPFVLDMSTSTAAIGKVEIQARKEMSIPSGWGVDRTGKETHDPHQVLDGGGLMALGGLETTAGYKGYGLAMMVEVMCGMMGGGMYATHIRKWTASDDRPADLGQAFIAVDPSAFAPDFEMRMDTFIQEMRQLEPSESGKPVMVAGDPERTHIKKVEEDGGIHYHQNLVQAMKRLAEQLNVSEMTTTRAPSDTT